MPSRFVSHLHRNVVGYLALFVALGGSSYAAVRLTPGSVSTSALARHAVTNKKLATNSVRAANVADNTLTPADFKSGTFVNGNRVKGARGPAGPAGPAGAKGVAGAAGGAYVSGRARSTGSVAAPHGGSTNVPLANGAWTQDANELDLIAGSVTLKTPSACTGSFGNALVISVDGRPTTFGAAPQAPASSTLTIPVVVGTLSEPGSSTQHTITAALANSCTKSGEDYAVQDVKLDVLKFG